MGRDLEGVRRPRHNERIMTAYIHSYLTTVAFFCLVCAVHEPRGVAVPEDGRTCHLETAINQNPNLPAAAAVAAAGIHPCSLVPYQQNRAWGSAVWPNPETPECTRGPKPPSPCHLSLPANR